MAWWPAHAHGLLPERAADFVIDALSNGRRLKCLAIVDDLSRKAVEIVVEPGILGGYAARILGRAARLRGYPKAVRTDQHRNGAGPGQGGASLHSA